MSSLSLKTGSIHQFTCEHSTLFRIWESAILKAWSGVRAWLGVFLSGSLLAHPLTSGVFSLAAPPRLTDDYPRHAALTRSIVNTRACVRVPLQPPQNGGPMLGQHWAPFYGGCQHASSPVNTDVQAPPTARVQEAGFRRILKNVGGGGDTFFFRNTIMLSK